MFLITTMAQPGPEAAGVPLCRGAAVQGGPFSRGHRGLAAGQIPTGGLLPGLLPQLQWLGALGPTLKQMATTETVGRRQRWARAGRSGRQRPSDTSVRWTPGPGRPSLRECCLHPDPTAFAPDSAPRAVAQLCRHTAHCTGRVSGSRPRLGMQQAGHQAAAAHPPPLLLLPLPAGSEAPGSPRAGDRRSTSLQPQAPGDGVGDGVTDGVTRKEAARARPAGNRQPSHPCPRVSIPAWT